jgi:hypothetical protein
MIKKLKLKVGINELNILQKKWEKKKGEEVKENNRSKARKRKGNNNIKEEK